MNLRRDGNAYLKGSVDEPWYCGVGHVLPLDKLHGGVPHGMRGVRHVAVEGQGQHTLSLPVPIIAGHAVIAPMRESFGRWVAVDCRVMREVGQASG